MEGSNALVLIPESRLRALLEESAEKAVRRTLRGVIDHAAPARPGKEFMTNREAMAYLGKSRPTLARYRADGTLPFSKVKGSVYYRRADVLALIESGRQER